MNKRAAQSGQQSGISYVDLLIVIGAVLVGTWIGMATADKPAAVTAQHLIARCERDNQTDCQLTAQPKE